MGYYFPWVLLMLASLVASVWVFLWALRSGQLAEQARAAYLPLRDTVEAEEVSNPGRITREVYALMCLMAGAGGCLIAALALVLAKR